MKPYRFTWLIAFWVAVFVTYVPWVEHSSLHYALLGPDISETSKDSSASLPDEFPVVTKLVVKRNPQASSLRIDDSPFLPLPLLTAQTERVTLFQPFVESKRELHPHLSLLSAASRAPPATDSHA